MNLKFWRDPDFGPTAEDPHGTKSLYFNDPPPGYPNPLEIQWRHLHELCPDLLPQFMDNYGAINDVCQGEIGDCWLISALSVIATKKARLLGTNALNIDSVKKGDFSLVKNFETKSSIGQYIGN